MAILEKWEYKFVSRSEFFPDLLFREVFQAPKELVKQTESRLNNYGAEGWEWIPFDAEQSGQWVVFRRRVSP